MAPNTLLPTCRSEKMDRSSTRRCLPSDARVLMSCTAEGRHKEQGGGGRLLAGRPQSWGCMAAMHAAYQAAAAHRSSFNACPANCKLSAAVQLLRPCHPTVRLLRPPTSCTRLSST